MGGREGRLKTCAHVYWPIIYDCLFKQHIHYSNGYIQPGQGIYIPIHPAQAPALYQLPKAKQTKAARHGYGCHAQRPGYVVPCHIHASQPVKRAVKRCEAHLRPLRAYWLHVYYLKRRYQQQEQHHKHCAAYQLCPFDLLASIAHIYGLPWFILVLRYLIYYVIFATACICLCQPPAERLCHRDPTPCTCLSRYNCATGSCPSL